MLVPTVLFGVRMLEYEEEEKKIEEISIIIESALVKDEQTRMDQCVAEEGVEVDQLAGYVSERDLVDLDEVRKLNQHVDGILRIDGTKIDYPVMRTEELDYYIHRDFYGKESVYGSIFMDGISRDKWPNTLVYGHHMKNGAMFGELDRYSEESYKDEHPILKYITNEAIEIYRICAAFATDVSNEGVIENIPLFDRKQAEALEAAINKSGGRLYGDLGEGNEFISLITCEYTHENGRYIVIGEKVGEVLR